jgi:hypothetical protein
LNYNISKSERDKVKEISLLFHFPLIGDSRLTFRAVANVSAAGPMQASKSCGNETISGYSLKSSIDRVECGQTCPPCRQEPQSGASNRMGMLLAFPLIQNG